MQSNLMNITAIDSNFRHLDYYPLINARVHPIGKSDFVMNTQLKSVYKTLIEFLYEKKDINSQDKMSICYYLLLQDRISEAI